MVNKFEAVGIGVSIAAMAAALYLVRSESSPVISEAQIDTQVASVVVAEDGSDRRALLESVVEATTDEGVVEKMIIDDVIIGSGESVAEGDTVTVHYIGALQNGQQFDNSHLRGTPFEFTVGEGKVIKGWDTGVIGMKEGGQRILVIPSDLAYGENGFGPIPAGATLVFSIELITIK